MSCVYMHIHTYIIFLLVLYFIQTCRDQVTGLLFLISQYVIFDYQYALYYIYIHKIGATHKLLTSIVLVNTICVPFYKIENSTPSEVHINYQNYSLYYLLWSIIIITVVFSIILLVIANVHVYLHILFTNPYITPC